MSDRPPLLFHVGAHKTGTTAMQAMLAALRPDLRVRGIAYPDLRPWTRGSEADHNALAHLVADEGPRAVWRRWQARRGLRRSAGLDRTVLSAEAVVRHVLGQGVGRSPEAWFPAHAAYLARLAGFLRDFEVSALLYLRQPDTAVISMFKENVVRGMPDGRRDLAGFIAAKAARFDYPREIATLSAAFPRLDVLSYEAEAKTGLLTGLLARIGAADLAPPRLPDLRTSPGNRATLWLQRALGQVGEAEYRHRALFCLRPEAAEVFDEAERSTLWPSAAVFAEFLAAHQATYVLPFLTRPEPPALPCTRWDAADHARAEAAFAGWRQANAALLAERDRRRLRHYDPDPALP